MDITLNHECDICGSKVIAQYREAFSVVAITPCQECLDENSENYFKERIKDIKKLVMELMGLL